MKSFSSFIIEQQTRVQALNGVFGGFNIARSEMPQIKDQKAFFDFLESKGVNVILLDWPTKSLKPTQLDFDQTKVDSIKAAEPTLDPIIAANDLFVLDGHHRYFAQLQSGNKSIKAYFADVSINILLAHAYEYSGAKDD